MLKPNRAEQKAKWPALNTLNDETCGQLVRNFSGRIYFIGKQG
jgi:hypothetical protein